MTFTDPFTIHDFRLSANTDVEPGPSGGSSRLNGLGNDRAVYVPAPAAR